MVEPGESIEDKERNLIDGIRRHYAAVSAQAETYRTRPDLPVLATGHLFASAARPPTATACASSISDRSHK